MAQSLHRGRGMWKVNKLLVGLICVVAIALTASSASAITITLSDIDDPNPDVFLMGGTSTYSGTWDLTADADWIANISPATSLAGWNIDSVRVDIAITDNAAQNGGAAALRFESEPTAIPFGVTTSVVSFSQTWTSDPALGSFSLFASISATGILDYTVTRSGGNGFTLANTALTVVATEQEEEAVPDGGTTLTMLGLGMVGLGALRRRLGT